MIQSVCVLKTKKFFLLLSKICSRDFDRVYENVETGRRTWSFREFEVSEFSRCNVLL